MKQFKKILSFELFSYFKNKIFVGVTVFLVVLIAAVLFFPRIDAALGTEDDAIPAERDVLLVKVDGKTQSELVMQTFSAVFADYDVRLTAEDDSAIKEQVLAGDAACAFVMNGPTSYTYYVDNLSMYDANTELADGALRQVYQMHAMLDSGMTAEQANGVMNIQIASETQSLGKNQAENFFYTYIMIFALYMVILLYGQMVATNVATEKSSRAMELLITSAKPASMMFGKVTASCLAGLLQLVAVFGSSLVFYHINRSYWGENMIVSSIFNIPPELLAFMLVFFVLGFLVYAFMFGAVGSTASKLEDINTSVMPITFLFVISFMVVMTSMGSGDVDNPVMTVCSYIPFTSPMAMFTRIAMSNVSPIEIATSIAILIASTVGIGMLSAKIYRAGVLLYGTPPKLSVLLKTVWKA